MIFTLISPLTRRGTSLRQCRKTFLRTWFAFNLALLLAAPAAQAGTLGKITFFSDRDGNREIYVMEPDGSAQTRLTNNPALDDVSTFSRDGSRICFTTRRDGNLEVYVMNVDGSGQTNVTRHPSDDFYGTFSADGTRMAFTSTRTGNDVFIMNADGSNQVQLTTAPGVDDNPRFSPDGSKLIFVSNRDGNFEIYSMNVNGTGQTRLTNNPGTDYAPAFRADGGKIAFASNRDGNLDIYTMNPDGSNQVRITTNPADDDHPSFSPDGSRIVFHSYRDGQPEIYVMNADGGSQTRLTNSPGDDRFPYWGPDYALAATGYRISGRIMAGSGAALANVRVERRGPTAGATPLATSTNSAGYYTFNNVPRGDYVVSPSLPGYGFAPDARNVSVTANVDGQNFVGGIAYSISGRITDAGGTPLTGAAVARSFSNRTVLTNSAGYFTFIGVPNGSYSVTPAFSNYQFSPPTRGITVHDANVSGVNFVGGIPQTAPTYLLSGRIAGSSGVGLSGISVARSGSNTGLLTNSAGYYTFIGVPDGTYTVTPSGNGLTFTPSSRSTAVNGANVGGLNFIGY